MADRLLSGAVEVFATAVIIVWLGSGVRGVAFTLRNNCAYTIWPGILTGNGGRPLNGGGFRLNPGQSVGVTAPENWSGRFWGRTGCNFDGSGRGHCATGDCGNVLQCNGAGGVPPVTLAEFTLGGKDFYDVSLVDGYNVPLKIAAVGGTGDCKSAGCVRDLNPICPSELRVVLNGQVVACKSACAAFGSAEFCCTGDHSTPQTCPPTRYSRIFKSACPAAYSYAYDDPSSTFTCSHSNYVITFCPSNLKSPIDFFSSTSSLVSAI